MPSEKITESDSSETELWGYKRSLWRMLFTWLCCLLSGFLLRLVFHWVPRWYVVMSHCRCGLQEAEVVLCRDQYGQYWIHRLLCPPGPASRPRSINRRPSRSQTEEALTAGERYFEHKKVKYVWDCREAAFSQIRGLEQLPCSDFYQRVPLTDPEVRRSQALYGENHIDVKVTSIVTLFFREGLNPFYIFQVCSCVLWFLDDYTVYASCIIVMSVLSLSVQLYETRKNERALRTTVRSSGESVVCRGRASMDGYAAVYDKVDARVLVPGDVIEIPRSGCLMHCDAVLIAGDCIVNESMLTGESVPVTKTPLPNPRGMDPFTLKTPIIGRNDHSNDNLLDTKKHSRHILFCGTNIIQARNFDDERILAVIIRTGYLTAKGELVRSIIFPRPVDIKFNKDALKFLLMLAGFALIGFVYTVVIMVRRQVSVGKIIVRSLDLITIVVPPALPVAMTIGVVFAQSRLKKKKIFCISPNTINVCGGINVACFDKTGTLTEDGLDLWGVVASKVDGSFAEVEKNPKNLPVSNLVEGMATCHSLTFIDVQLCGDPLDLRMFLSTGWELKDHVEGDQSLFQMSVPLIAWRKGPGPGDDQDNHVGILRQFPFSSTLQRMSVVTKSSSKTNFNAYVKGSPEVLFTLCRKETLPRDFSSKLLELTREGYRVLALAYRPMKVSYSKAMRIPRQEVECDLRFLGLLVMENRLKPETEEVIKELKEAMIRPVMVTGDNMLTALSVSRDCGIIAEMDKVVLVDARRADNADGAVVEFHYAEDLQRQVNEISILGKEFGAGDGHMKMCMFDRSDFHLALSGKTWAVIREQCPQLIPKLVVKGSVFARFSPDQKTQLVEALQSVGYFVAMCGDGANDCGALKVAHAGVALSEAEASVASPFTSKVHNVSCVPQLIKEGRCALTTSVGTFRFMAGYSFTQFISVLILYWVTANLGDFQFLYIDLFVITTLSISCGYARAHQTLSVDAPSVRLLSTSMVSSLVLQWVINAAIQMTAYFYVYSQAWYFMPKEQEDDDVVHNSFANTAIFSVSVFQYLILAVIFSKGPPFRAAFYTNYIFLANVISILCLSLYFVIKPFDWLRGVMNLIEFPSLWVNGILLCFVVANFILSFIVELIIDSVSLRRQMFRIKVVLFPQSVDQLEYERIREEINKNSSVWPPIIKSASVQDMRPEIFTDATVIQGSHSAQDLVSYNERDHYKDMEVLKEEMELEDTLQVHLTTVGSNGQPGGLLKIC